MSSTLIRLGQGGSISFKDGVATSSLLPLTGNAIEDVRPVLSPPSLWMWDGSTWINTDTGGGSGVGSLNGQTGSLNLIAGTNVTIVPGVGTLTINSIAGSVTFPILAPDGTVSAPSYSFASATNTGMYIPSVGNLGLAIAGTEIINISASGTVLNSGLRVQSKTVTTNYSIL